MKQTDVDNFWINMPPPVTLIADTGTPEHPEALDCDLTW